MKAVSGGTTAPALFTDLYELTMLRAYHAEGLSGMATFSLFVRELPPSRNYLVACGLENVLRFLETFRFSPEDLSYLRKQGFPDEFLLWLGEMRFDGTVRAMPEGTPFFAGEPICEIEAPISTAQVVETLVLNQIHFQTVIASKAARVVSAARGRTVVDFSARRTHGVDAAVDAARAMYIAGVDATSNVLAGREHGIPIMGTMAHSYIQAHESESRAFEAFTETFPETVLLVDTYDTLMGIQRIVELARQCGPRFRVRGVRLDSGDLHALSVEARRRLESVHLGHLEIFASGGLNEDRIASLLSQGAPIDGFGVGTNMGVSSDCPALDMAYKLVAYEGEDRIKLSTGKRILPGSKQVFRSYSGGRAVGDLIGGSEEALPGKPLLVEVMRDGKRVRAPETLDAARCQARRSIASLPSELQGLSVPSTAYPVEISPLLRRKFDKIEKALHERTMSAA